MRSLPMISDSPKTAHSDPSIESEIHIFESLVGTHAFVTNGSRIYDINKSRNSSNNEKIKISKLNEIDLLEIVALTHRDKYISPDPVKPPPLFYFS